MKAVRRLLLAVLALASATVMTPGQALAQTPGPTDPQIAAIVVAANQADIDAGKLAESKTHSKDVKMFAQRMVADHGSVNQSAVALVHKLGVTPEANPTSDSLKQGGETNIANLKSLQGAQFDHAYIDHEVAYHEQVIDALDKTLIPSAQNAELKALLVKVRPTFVAHLDHAKRLQASLAKAQ
jgi:putative membrane protein